MFAILRQLLSVFLYSIIHLLVSCSGPKGDNGTLASTDSAMVNEATNVQTKIVKRKSFVAQTMTNGTVLALQEIPLKFLVQGIVKEVKIYNGASTKRGQLLASLENDTQKLALNEAQLQLDESLVEVNDLLITQGGKRGDSTSVAKDVFSYIKLRSGYNRAVLALQKARLDYERTFLYAPTDGIVANLTLSSYSPVEMDKAFCTLVNRKEMLVRCNILESELKEVALGQTARIQPIGFFGIEYLAKVININPIVNDQGLVEITGRILRPSDELLSGMNVRVQIEKTFSNQLTIPKEAVVERNSRKVVFVFKNGLAKWLNVTTGLENDREIVITEGLEAGDEVIVNGNLNLAHNAKVEKVRDIVVEKD